MCSCSHGYHFVSEETKYCNSGDPQVLEGADFLKIFFFVQRLPSLVGETVYIEFSRATGLVGSCCWVRGCELNSGNVLALLKRGIVGTLRDPWVKLNPVTYSNSLLLKKQASCRSCVICVEVCFNTGVAWGLAGVIHRDVKDEVKGEISDLNEVVVIYGKSWIGC